MLLICNYNYIIIILLIKNIRNYELLTKSISRRLLSCSLHAGFNDSWWGLSAALHPILARSRLHIPLLGHLRIKPRICNRLELSSTTRTAVKRVGEFKLAWFSKCSSPIWNAWSIWLVFHGPIELLRQLKNHLWPRAISSPCIKYRE